MSRPESLADAFVTIMGRVREIDADVQSDDSTRHDYWRLRQLAEACIADGFRRAADVADVALGMRLRAKQQSSECTEPRKP